MKSFCLFGALCLLLLPRAANADAVMPPPDHCPPGLMPRTSHQGPRCEPTGCGAEQACPDGSACRDVGLCQRQQPAFRGTYTVVQGLCDADGTCPAPSEGEPFACRQFRRCEPSAPHPAWDATARRWLPDAPSGAVTPPSNPPAPEAEPPSVDEPTVEPDEPIGATDPATEEESSSGGCAVRPQTGGSPPYGVVFFLAALGMRRLRTR
ncbi:MAG: hypothetical protein AB8I08_20700 [Sandaracinaceae bacterium]